MTTMIVRIVRMTILLLFLFKWLLYSIGMAEAHQAVSYSKLVKHDQNTSHNHDKEHLQFVCESKPKSWEKWLNQIARKLYNAVYPAHVQSFWIILLLVMALHFGGRKVPFDLVYIVLGLLSG